MSLTMRFPKKLVNIWILLAVGTFPSSVSGKAITCTAGDFAAGTNASFMCYFPDDIDNHDSVYIQHYPLNASTNAAGSQVFFCKVAEVKAATCKGKDGYVLKRYTRNTISIEVVNVTEKAGGRYTCQFVPPTQSPKEMCDLRVHEAGTPSSADDHPSKSGGTGTVSLEIIVSVIVSVLAVAAIIAFAVLMYRRLKSKNSSAPTETREETRHESVTTPAEGLNDSTAPLLKTQDTRLSSPAARSAPTETREESRRESVTTPAAGSAPTETREESRRESVTTPAAGSAPTETRGESRRESVTTPAAGSEGKPSYATQESVESKTAMPSVQDGIEMDSGVNLSSLKFPDKLKVSGSKENISYNYEKIKNPIFLAKDSNKSDPTSLLVGIYRSLDGLDERLRRVEEVTSSSFRSLTTSNNAKISEEILQDLLRELSRSGTQLEQERDRIHKLLGEVQRGEVDPQTHEAIQNTAAKRRQP